MTNAFDFAIAFDLNIEGGYVDDPRDPGGETKFGISKRAYPSLDIRNLSREAAIEIYRRDYWKACRCDELPSALAVAVFDCAVNQGVDSAIRMLQGLAGTTVDGVLGTLTLDAVRRRQPQVADYLAVRALHYSALKTFPIYGRGWMRRLFHLQHRLTEGLD